MFKSRFHTWVIILLTALLINGCTESTKSSVVIIEPGSHAIVLEPDPSPSEVHAAEELRTHVQACMGWEIPILEDPSEAQGPMIVLGCGPAALDLGVDPDPEDLGEQGFVVTTVSPHLVIAGTREAGTLYGVHRFLEEHFHVRWHAPGVTKTPATTQVIVPPTDRLVSPAFQWRHTSYTWPGRDAAFMARTADNAGSGGPDHPYGIQHGHDGQCHSYFWFVSPDEFFDTHPEYFSEIGGVRIRNLTQLCLTNPDVLEIVTERMLERMARMPHVQQHNFSQMDCYNYCQCPNCRAVNEQYGTKGGTQFWFVNQLAERTSQIYPDKLIGTLAYTYTQEPPQGMVMHPNVAVWLCKYSPSCSSHPIVTCPLNVDYKRRAERWVQITHHLYVWYYGTNFNHYYVPFPNFRTMAEDMRFHRDIGVEGIFLQGMGHHGGGGEFSLLRPYYGMKLLWDPDQDPVELRRDFLKGYYGRAWEPIHTYIEMLHDKVEHENIHMHLYTNPAQGYLTDDIMARSKALFDEAESRVPLNLEVLERVRTARMPLIYAECFPRNGFEIVDNRMIWQNDPPGAGEFLRFLARMNEHGFEFFRESIGEIWLLSLQYLMLQVSPKIVNISSDYLSVDVVPLLAGRALRITDRESGEFITAYNVKEHLVFPLSGGLEDSVGGESWLFFGWMEPAFVVDLSDRSIKTSALTIGGFQLDRTLTLDPDAPILYVDSILTNPGNESKMARLANRIELDLGEVGQMRVRFTNLAGEDVDQDMAGVIDQMSEGEPFFGENVPDGSWVFTGTKGIELTQSFRNEEVDSTWLFAYPGSPGELELEVQLWSERRSLGPGESLALHQEIEVRAME